MKKTTSYVNKKLNGNNTFLYVSAIATTVVDVILAVILLVGGRFDLVAALAVLDILLVITAFNSNFRFKYSLLAPILYIIACTVICVLVSFSSLTVITNASLIWFIALHLLPAIALIVNVVSIARFGSKFKLGPCVLSIITAIASVAYVIVALTSGFYGQGSFGYRNIQFYLDVETDTYVAERVIDGFGTKLNIPETYNGKKVSAIEGKILSASGLKEIYFNTPADVEILYANEITDVDDDCKLFIDKTQIDTFRERMVSLSRTYPTGINDYLSLMNATVPVNLAEGERYITFDYTATSLQQADYQILKTWIAPSSKTLDLSVVGEGIDYAEDFDIDNETFLYQTYTRNDMLLCFNTDQGLIIDSGDVTTESNLVVSFDNVYRVKIGDDNDTLYETSNSFKSFDNSGYRYVLGADHKDLLSTIETRDGFDLAWEYTSSTHSTKTPLSSLSEVVDQTNLTVYPKWTLRAPVISSLNKDKSSNYIYGEDVTFTANATAPHQTISLKYEWIKDGSLGAWTSTSSVKTYQKSNLFPSDAGYYLVRVTAYSDTITSLTSTAQKSIQIKVDKKPLDVQWNLPENVYTGETQPVSAQRVESDVINGDDVTVLMDVTSIKNVGNYTFNLTLGGKTANLYQLTETSKNFTLNPYTVESGVIWNNLTFTYDAIFHVPTASVYGIGDESSTLIPLTVDGGKINAGKYNATATFVDTDYENNYTISSSASVKEFVIEKKEITATTTNNNFVYNGNAQAPTYTAVGVGTDTSIPVNVSGKQTNAGNDYVVTLSLPAKYATNYKLSSTQATFSIAKAQVDVSWSTATITYNGANQTPTATAHGIKNESLHLSITGGGANAGSGYTATASINTSYDLEIQNYYLNDSTTTKTFSIAKKSVSAVWSNTSFVYNASVRQATAKATFLSADGGSKDLVVNGGSGTDVGSYPATASLPSDYEVNYTLTNVSGTLSITQATATVVWGATTFTYNGFAQAPTATATGVSGQSVSLSISGAQTDAGRYQATATTDNGNYKLSNATVWFTIEKINLTVTWNKTDFTYDGSQKTPIATIANVDAVVSGDVVNLTYKYYYGNSNLTEAPTDAGVYRVEVSVSNPNYQITNASTTFNIVSAQA